jgi:type IV pilus assembly protein PilC
MSLYHYRACNAAGETVTGALEAESFAAMEHRLRRSGVWLLDAREGVRAGAAKVGRVSVSRGELIEFFVQMTLLLRARINLPTSLERVAADFRDQRLGRVVADLHEQVTSGVPMHEAMAAHPAVFPAQVVAMVQAGEVSGTLPEVFDSLTTYYQWLDQLLGEVRQALIYPMMVTGATVALVIGLFTFIVPRFVELLQGLSLQVPVVTRVVISISHFLTADWPVLLGLAAGLPVTVKLLLRIDPIARGFDRALMELPIFGDLIAMFALSRFAQNLGMLYKSGVPLVRGLEICRHLAGNRAIAKALDEVRRGVSEGVPLSRCLGSYDFFPSTLVTMISTGETSGRLDFALQSVSDYYNKIIPRRIKAIFSIFDPVVMVVLIGTVGAVALAVVLPILQLWQAR